jgi:hypothetical protein
VRPLAAFVEKRPGCGFLIGVKAYEEREMNVWRDVAFVRAIGRPRVVACRHPLPPIRRNPRRLASTTRSL